MRINPTARTAVDDEELMRLVKGGDAAAFEQLYDRHQAAAYGLARRICRTPERSADATQEAFLSLWRTRASYDPARGSLRSWILLLARNKAIDVLRRTAAHDRRLTSDEGVAQTLEAPERTDTEAARRIEASSLRAALVKLPEEQRRVIELAYFAGLTHTEIAGSLRIPQGTVKGRMRLGLTKLRNYFDVQEPARSALFE